MNDIKVFNWSHNWSKIGSYSNHDPYCIVFCYPMVGENYIIKGGWQKIREYLSNITIFTFVNATVWKHGKSRNYFSFHGRNDIKLYVRRRYDEKTKTKRKGFKIIYYRINNTQEIGKYRKMPKAFPRAVLDFVKNNKV